MSAARRFKHYPPVAIDRNWQGTAQIRVEIAANGEIAALKVRSSAGYPVLDDHALEMIERAKAIAPIPLALRGKPFFVDIPIEFLLRDALKLGPSVLNELEKEGTVQRFEYTVELAWKTLKDYLEDSGMQLTSVTPKSVIKAAFAARLITDGQIWIDILVKRNLLSHKYDQELLGESLTEIHERYLPAIEQLQKFFQEQSR